MSDHDVRMLVVDDHPAFLRTVERLVAATPGFVVSATASSGDEALSKLANDHRIDLVLLDVNLPDRSGVDVARSYSKTGGTAVVALMSTNELADLAGDALTTGVAGFVIKEQLTTALLRDIWFATSH